MTGIMLIGLGMFCIILWGIGLVTILLAMKSEQSKTISLMLAVLVALTPLGWVAFGLLIDDAHDTQSVAEKITQLLKHTDVVQAMKGYERVRDYYLYSAFKGTFLKAVGLLQ